MAHYLRLGQRGDWLPIDYRRAAMNENEVIEQALQAERRILQRQQLLKRLWRLSQRKKSRRPASAKSPECQGAPT